MSNINRRTKWVLWNFMKTSLFCTYFNTSNWKVSQFINHKKEGHIYSFPILPRPAVWRRFRPRWAFSTRGFSWAISRSNSPKVRDISIRRTFFERFYKRKGAKIKRKWIQNKTPRFTLFVCSVAVLNEIASYRWPPPEMIYPWMSGSVDHRRRRLWLIC